ncbi:MAG: hypothetical protein LBS11_11685 [Oscillospiraceae bacterium]|nr:hypothetical protein [Oscillospiraceae bacterium]
MGVNLVTMVAWPGIIIAARNSADSGSRKRKRGLANARAATDDITVRAINMTR